MENIEALQKLSKNLDYLLLLMRHAQAQPSSSGADRTRPLTVAGIDQAKRMGEAITRMSIVPQRIACSGATRTRQTLDQMLPTFGDDPKVEYKERLYAEGAQAVLDELTATKEKDKTLLILGHEPSISMCAQLLSDVGSNPKAITMLNLGMSLANVAVLASDRPFNAWNMRSAQLVGIFGPHDFSQ